MLRIVVGSNVSIPIAEARKKNHLRGFKIANIFGSPLRGEWTMVASNVSIAMIVDARKTSLTGVQNI